MRLKYLVGLAFMAIPFLMGAQTLETINDPTIKIKELTEVGPFSEGLAAVRKDGKWGFIDMEGNLAVDFRDDVVWNQNADESRNDIKGIKYPKFKNGLCAIQMIKDEGIPYYGFMNTQGKVAIEPEYLNVTGFKDDRAIGIYCRRTFRGKNDFQLNIYDYALTEVVLNNMGEIIWPISKREDISMSKRRYQTPNMAASFISSDLILIKTGDNDLQICKISEQTQKP
ncbi:WG repeat-containing protein [Flagellimonas halotolerans]|uniref:WG repeat-containing protein n=1 Tax=Flagellimonas halotolerans TaxID=3112164 RepID=A0ABU6IPF4_9FLAO|nr:MULTISPECIES: WG repeat-containing protein [unclassified Allomuricauda]MEC3965169.1 WG repeat-containing protein [Muricauda sp. SYSU M86414]MEC4264986.1 WG repeat-containing protein [Muricauda sp. SYSU M84420]